YVYKRKAYFNSKLAKISFIATLEFESSGQLTNGIPVESYSYINQAIGTTPISSRLFFSISSLTPSFIS
ncbi:hypothetical protein, partial [Clostridioides difficile]|uniref:hypothetical protein n=1 Tax=Clostridioides difficile TaxID=1496 RepID=UPI0013DF699B